MINLLKKFVYEVDKTVIKQAWNISCCMSQKSNFFLNFEFSIRILTVKSKFWNLKVNFILQEGFMFEAISQVLILNYFGQGGGANRKGYISVTRRASTFRYATALSWAYDIDGYTRAIRQLFSNSVGLIPVRIWINRPPRRLSTYV